MLKQGGIRNAEGFGAFHATTGHHRRDPPRRPLADRHATRKSLARTSCFTFACQYGQGDRRSRRRIRLEELSAEAIEGSTPNKGLLPSLINKQHQIESETQHTTMQAPRTVSGRLHQDASVTHAQDELELGDTVEVPGGNRGIVKFIGSIEGKNGLFAGVELGRESAAFGKNNGDVDGYGVIDLRFARRPWLTGKECSTLHAPFQALASFFQLIAPQRYRCRALLR